MPAPRLERLCKVARRSSVTRRQRHGGGGHQRNRERTGVTTPVRKGRLYGIGLGPGDPELVTVKAARLIGAADVIAYHSARHGRSIARQVAAPYVRADQLEE